MITTHILDTALGRPASGVHVVLEVMDTRDRWNVAGRGVTDANGRLGTLLSTDPDPGTYRLVFDTRGYFEALGTRAFFPHVTITFTVAEGDGHYHVPLLLSPFGYSTYRGS